MTVETKIINNIKKAASDLKSDQVKQTHGFTQTLFHIVTTHGNIGENTAGSDIEKSWLSVQNIIRGVVSPE